MQSITDASEAGKTHCANAEASCVAYSSCACVRQHVNEGNMRMKECAMYAEGMVMVSLSAEVLVE